MRRFLAAVAMMLAACGGDGESSTRPTFPIKQEIGAPTSSAAVAQRTPTSSTSRAAAPTTAQLATLGESATCGDFLNASEPQREAATRAALIVARRAAGGVSPTPSEEVRALFEIRVGLVCDGNRTTRMLNAMAVVVAQHPEYLD